MRHKVTELKYGRLDMDRFERETGCLLSATNQNGEIVGPECDGIVSKYMIAFHGKFVMCEAHAQYMREDDPKIEGPAKSAPAPEVELTTAPIINESADWMSFL